MKLKETNNQEIVIGALNEQEFGIDESNPVIFDILRNKMYSNKIGAICREVPSNSRDANREAGRGDVPIEIEFTSTQNIYNIGDTCVIFRDFGVGITPDRMTNVFLKYAASTKRSTDAQTGGFGLGAKTPFAYTDSFIIKTVCNWAKPIMGAEIVEEIIDNDTYNDFLGTGVEFELVETKGNYHEILIERQVVVGHEDEKKWEFTYNAIIDRTGKGKMITLNEKIAEDSQSTGTEIIVPIVTSQDKSLFEKECYKATSMWENVNYINFLSKKPELDCFYEGDGVKIVHYNSELFGYNVPYVGIIDGIPYPMKPSVAPNGLGSDFHVLIDVELSKVTINASRESVQDDEETIAYLDNIVKGVEDVLKEQVEDYLTNHADFREALKKWHRVHGKHSYHIEYTDLEQVINACNSGYSNRLLSNEDYSVMYNDEKVKGRFGLKHHKIVKVSKGDIELDENGKLLKCKFVYKNLDTIGLHLTDSELYYMDSARYASTKNLKLLDDKKEFLAIKPVSDVSEEQIAEDKDRLDYLGIEYNLYSEVVPDKKKIEYGKRTRKDVKIPAREAGYTDYKESFIYSYEDKILKKYGKEIQPEDILFIPMASVRNSGGYDYTEDGYMLPVLKALGKLVDKKIYVVNESTFNRHLAPNGYFRVKDVYKKMSKKYIQRLRDYDDVREIFDNCISEFLVDNFIEILPASTVDLVKLRKQLNRMKVVNPSKLSYVNWNRLGIEKSKFNYDGFAEAYRNKMKKKYPMLMPYLNTFSSSKLTLEHKDTEMYKTVKEVVNNYLKCQ